MSKVIAEYDTETKELKLMIDGKETSEVTSVNFYSVSENYDGKTQKYGSFEASFKKIEQDGVKYCMSAYGSEIKTSDSIEDYIRTSLSKK